MFNWINPLSANLIKWSNTHKQFVGNFHTNCLSVFDHFVELVLKGLNILILIDWGRGAEQNGTIFVICSGYYLRIWWFLNNFFATTIHKILEKNSSFYVKQRTAKKVPISFFQQILLTLKKFSFWEEGWALG